MTILFANNANSTLAAGINATDLSITVATGEGSKFPSPTGGDYFLATLTQGSGTETSWEIVKVTAKSGDNLTVERAQEGTSAAIWTAGSKISLRITKGEMEVAANAVSGPASSTDNGIALFDGTTGKLLKQATTTGILKASSGVIGAAVSGTDIKTVNGTSLLGSGDIAISSGYSGATTTNLTSGSPTLTLTSASDQIQVITTDGSSTCNVVLPNGTTMTEGGFPFIVQCKGASVKIKDYSGVTIRTLLYNELALCMLNDPASDKWGIGISTLAGIGVGIASVFESASTYFTSVAMLDSTKAIVTYRDGGNSNYGTSCVLSISGTTITAGTPVVFESASTAHISVAMLDSTKAIVTYTDNGNLDYGTSCVLSISGTTITAGTPAVFESANTSYTSVAMLDSTKAIVTYQDNGNSGYGTSCVLVNI